MRMMSDRTHPSRYTVAAWVLTGVVLILVLQLHVLPALLAGMLVYELVHAVDVPVIGVGGIRTGEDALEFLCCGASAVQVGTATFYDPAAPVRIADEIARWCHRHGISRVADVIGTLRT